MADREASIADVVSACGVDRDAAKNLFVRLLFFGGLRAWLDDHPDADAERMPAWLEATRAGLRAAAERLMELPDLAELKQAFARRPPPPEGPERHGNRRWPCTSSRRSATASGLWSTQSTPPSWTAAYSGPPDMPH